MIKVILALVILVVTNVASAHETTEKSLVCNPCDGSHWINMRTRVGPYPRDASPRNVLANGFERRHPLRGALDIHISPTAIVTFRASRARLISLTLVTP